TRQPLSWLTPCPGQTGRLSRRRFMPLFKLCLVVSDTLPGPTPSKAIVEPDRFDVGAKRVVCSGPSSPYTARRRMNRHSGQTDPGTAARARSVFECRAERPSDREIRSELAADGDEFGIRTPGGTLPRTNRSAPDIPLCSGSRLMIEVDNVAEPAVQQRRRRAARSPTTDAD